MSSDFSYGHARSPLGGETANDSLARANNDLCRLARFGANLTDAHSCFIFLSTEVLSAIHGDPLPVGGTHDDALVLSGHHSLCSDVISHARIARGSGLIGWVARHNRAIHVSPFDHDSRTLGTYTNDQQLKSFIGVPINIELPGHAQRAAALRPQTLVGNVNSQSFSSGVIACDSKKSFAFSKLQGKLLEELAREISSAVELLARLCGEHQPETAWKTFLRRSEDLSAALGQGSVEVVRLTNFNFAQLERSLGTTSYIALVEQTVRLIQQALPPHFPLVRLPSGDILIALDNMMTSFYENRIRAVVEHLSSGNSFGNAQKVVFDFVRPAGAKDKRRRQFALDEMIRSTLGNASGGATAPVPGRESASSLVANNDPRRASGPTGSDSENINYRAVNGRELNARELNARELNGRELNGRESNARDANGGDATSTGSRSGTVYRLEQEVRYGNRRG